MRRAALITFGAAALTLAGWGYAYSCSFDVDCAVGSHCVRDLGELEGVCVGGLFPGNRHDLDPPRDPLWEGYGRACVTTLDCEPGHRCVGEGIYGTCL